MLSFIISRTTKVVLLETSSALSFKIKNPHVLLSNSPFSLESI